jgi:hypothetical protein
VCYYIIKRAVPRESCVYFEDATSEACVVVFTFCFESPPGVKK